MEILMLLRTTLSTTSGIKRRLRSSYHSRLNAMKYTCKAAPYPNIFVTDCLESLNVCSGLHRMIVFAWLQSDTWYYWQMWPTIVSTASYVKRVASWWNWADPEYYFSGIVVTKNFVASPHMDMKHKNNQDAMALGDFEGGGQLALCRLWSRLRQPRCQC
jgi:hypothetical protein